MNIPLGTLLLSFLLCGLHLFFARRWQILDRPNERSSHRLPVPLGGGVPLLLAFLLGLAALGWQLGVVDVAYLVILFGTATLCVLGAIDDLRGLSVSLRFAFYGLCCLLSAATLLAPLALPFAQQSVLLAIVAVALLWLLNLYNFMDGIDGIAATQAALAGVAAAWLSGLHGGDDGYAQVCLIFAASHCGFLLWNWPPARLFMGDAGSIASGFVLGSLAVLGAVREELPAACWLILLAVFITDSSYTLLWRIGSGQKFLQAHRLHAYQRLSRYWNGHYQVDLLLLTLFLFWLLPLAWLCVKYPGNGPILVTMAYVPLVAGMAKLSRLA